MQSCVCVNVNRTQRMHCIDANKQRPSVTFIRPPSDSFQIDIRMCDVIKFVLTHSLNPPALVTVFSLPALHSFHSTWIVDAKRSKMIDVSRNFMSIFMSITEIIPFECSRLGTEFDNAYCCIDIELVPWESIDTGKEGTVSSDVTEPGSSCQNITWNQHPNDWWNYYLNFELRRL